MGDNTKNVPTETVNDVIEVINTTKTKKTNGNWPVNGVKFRSTSDEHWFNKVPEYQRELVFIIKNNVGIRKYTATAILNYLLQKKEIVGTKRYVNFYWNKFQVKVDGIVKEYPYTETFFLNAFVAAFTSFAASAQRVINTFCKEACNKSLDKVVKEKDVQNIVAENDKSDNEAITEE